MVHCSHGFFDVPVDSFDRRALWIVWGCTRFVYVPRPAVFLERLRYELAAIVRVDRGRHAESRQDVVE